MEAHECHYEKKSIFKFRWFLCWYSLCQFVKRLRTIRYGTDAFTLIRLCVSSAGPGGGGGGGCGARAPQRGRYDMFQTDFDFKTSEKEILPVGGWKRC